MGVTTDLDTLAQAAKETKKAQERFGHSGGVSGKKYGLVGRARGAAELVRRPGRRASVVCAGAAIRRAGGLFYGSGS
ncbi:hypothetical protein AB3329_02840 [Streptococcus sp. H31]|uniref:hypothetical protein n=1 Tax=Streptococcus huangxiaojuni TaxID=3237239 RepID=UPI0034A56A7F